MLENMISQVKKTTLSQHVVKQLMELIINGTITAGEKLPSEKQLMELFGVGRSTLREAIRALVALGLVEVRVPEGTFVSDSFGDFFSKPLTLMSRISFENIAELVEARIAYESDLAELAAKKSTEDDHRKLDEILEFMRNSVTNEEWLKSDLAFHTMIGEIAQNSFMLQVLNILHDITREWIAKVVDTYSIKKDALQQHEAIVEAIKRKDEKQSRKAMHLHLETVSKLLFELNNKKEYKKNGDSLK